MKKCYFLIVLFVLINNILFADIIDKKGKEFFGENAQLDSYIMVAKKSPDIDIRRYAIRQLGKSNDPKAVEPLLDAITTDVKQIEARSEQNMEGSWQVRLEAARALGHITHERERILIVLRQTLMTDPTIAVQGESAIAMGMIGSKAPENIKILVVEYLKRKVSRTPINHTQVNLPIVTALGINGHISGRDFLVYMRSKGYPRAINAEIAKSLQKLR